MKTLLKNANVINVFTDQLIQQDVLIENEMIIGAGDYSHADADLTIDLSGKILSPGLIDSHVHIESSMMIPSQFASISLKCGTTAIWADPHEITNVCGKEILDVLLDITEDLPLHFYFMVPSCVPATSFDESGAVLTSDDIRPFYQYPRVLGLAEMMNYPGVINKDPETIKKVYEAHELKKIINGHAPLLSGNQLDAYISAGIQDDHECTNINEAFEKMQKGQWIMIREGTSAKNLTALMKLFESPYNHRCCLCSDDKNAADLLEVGHINGIIRKAVQLGADPLVAIRMASLQAAQCMGLRNVGAIAPGYRADLIVLNDLNSVDVNDVFVSGQFVVKDKELLPDIISHKKDELLKVCENSFYPYQYKQDLFEIKPESNTCRVIKLIKNQLITDEWITDLNFDMNNGIDIERDILKLAVIERHKGTGHVGLGYVNGFGLKCGAVAASVSHDSHNLIVVGSNDEDCAFAATRINQMGGGYTAVCDGEVISEIPLPVGGLMSYQPADEIAEINRNFRQAVIEKLGADEDLDLAMHLAFTSLLVIPSLKMSTQGLFDVNTFKYVDLFIN